MSYSFFAMMSRMKYIDRWALMRNSNSENISEHSLEVAMLSHALGIIANEKFDKSYNVDRLSLMGLYHDATEIITGDMPTPVKYYDADIRKAYKRVEEVAAENLLQLLPDYMKPYYEAVFFPNEEEKKLWQLVKAADKLSALIKCVEEEKAGNREFSTAKQSILQALNEFPCPEVKVFLTDFLPDYEKTLDELK